MATQRNQSSEETRLVGRRLISWPLALIGLTLALLFRGQFGLGLGPA